MSESKKETIKLNPFAQFNLLKGEFIPPDEQGGEEIEIKTGIENTIPEVTDEEAKRLEEGTKLIEENIKKAEAKKQGGGEAVNKPDNKSKEQLEENSSEEQENATEESLDEKLNPFKGLANEWYDKGIIDFNADDPDFKESEEGIDTLITKTRDNRINKWVDSLDPEYKEFLLFVQQGGKPKDFLNVYYGNNSWEQFKADNEDSQRLVIRESLVSIEGYSEDEAEEILAEWEVSGKLESRSKTHLNKLQKYEAAQKEQLLKQQAKIAEDQKNAEKEYFENLKKDVFSKEEIMGFKLTPKLKERLWDFLTVPDKKTGKTQYTQALENNKDSQLLFALQAMQGFDINKLEKQVQTKVSNNMGKLLKNYSEKDTRTRMSNSIAPEHKDDNPFAGFKNAKA